MILRSLRVEGFMRYQLLELEELPRGVIALVGENESGKTTIGEAVAFALFGRTVRTEDTDPTQAIHWEVDVCHTAIEVELPPRGRYRVERRVARTGEFEARLLGPEGQELASGPRQVSDALVELLGFDFPTFRYSFYVAQGELDLIQLDGRDNAKRIVYDMLGITTVERAQDLLQEALGEIRATAETLERDLIVANALHTEQLPLRDELAQLEHDLTAAEEAFRRAQAAEREAQTAEEMADQALRAQQARVAALAKLETALVVEAQRRNLLQAKARLQSLLSAAEAAVSSAEQAVEGEAAPRREAEELVARAEAAAAAATRLSALLEAHRQALGKELAPESSDSVPARIAHQREALEREGTGLATGVLVAALLLAVALGGVAAGFHTGPGGQPAFTLPGQLVSPRLNLTIDGVTPRRASLVVGVLAGLFALVALAAGLRRRSRAARAAEAASELERLEARRTELERERKACAGFEQPRLKDMHEALLGVQDEQVRAALKELQEAAGADLMQRAEQPRELLTAARARLGELEATARQAAPQLVESRRVAEMARKAFEKVEGSLALAYPEGVPEELPPLEEEPAADLPSLARQVEKATATAARARIELEALLSGNPVRHLAEPARELRDAITRGLEATGEAFEPLEARYKEQTGLPELLKDRAVVPSSESLRAVIKRERELLDELFRDPPELEARHRDAEEALRVARHQRREAEAERDDLRARGQRAADGRRRLEELEGRIADLQEALNPSREQVQAHEGAIQLLGELSQALKARFGPGLARYIELVLPRLTQGRYRRTRIDEDLDIRVYSRERGDYVRLIELSLGTADQLLIALRLGLARALIASRGLIGGHFLFLDEPLVSADAGREQAFFDLLRTFDDEFAQIFVTSPRSLPDEAPCARRLELKRDEHVVRLNPERAPA